MAAIIISKLDLIDDIKYIIARDYFTCDNCGKVAVLKRVFYKNVCMNCEDHWCSSISKVARRDYTIAASGPTAVLDTMREYGLIFRWTTFESMGRISNLMTHCNHKSDTYKAGVAAAFDDLNRRYMAYLNAVSAKLIDDFGFVIQQGLGRYNKGGIACAARSVGYEGREHRRALYEYD